MNNLFQKGSFILSSGKNSDFKLECDALTDADMECIAFLIAKKHKFRKAIGVKGRNGGDTGNGFRLEQFLNPHCTNDNTLPILICDDVYTTGKSIMSVYADINEDAVCVVIFDRSGQKCPSWVHPLITMNI